MTRDPQHWTYAEFCEFYDSTGCTSATVADYSCAPSCLASCPDAFCDTFSALQYCGQPHVDQVGKAATEGECLATVSESIPTTTVMNFSSIVAFNNIDTDAFLANEMEQEVAIVTLSNFISGIPADRIKILNITTLQSSARRSLRTDETRALTVLGSNVHYRVTAVLEELGFESTESVECFDSLVNQIDQSIAYGQFEATLILHSNAAGSTFMDSVVVDEASASVIDDVIMAVTTVPSSMPSPVPLVEDDDLSEGAIIAISIVVPLVVIGVVVFAYYWFVYRKKNGQNDSQSFLRKKSGSSSLGVDSSAGAKFDDL